MKHYAQALSFICFCFLLSCTASNINLTSDSNEERTLWISSEYNSQGFAHPNGGGTFAKECFKATEDDVIYFGGHAFEPPLDFKDPVWETFCGDIEGLDYKEGNYYKVKIKKKERIVEKTADGSVDFSKWQLVSVLETKEDLSYERKEVVECWVAPKKIEVPCSYYSPMAPLSCKTMLVQTQEGDLDKTGKWNPSRDLLTGFKGYEEGSFYKVTYTRVYPAKSAPKIADAITEYQVKDIKILEIIKE